MPGLVPRRVAAAVAAAALLFVAPPADAEFAGHVRRVQGAASLRGLDGAIYRFTFDVRNSYGSVGSESSLEARMTVARCVGGRCGRPVKYVRALTSNEYAEAGIDHGVTRVQLPYGRLFLALEWTSEAGWGSLPPAVDSTDGLRVTTQSSAHLALVAGIRVGKTGARYVPCHFRRGTVSTYVRVTQSEEFAQQTWPQREPAGLAVKAKGKRFISCAAD